MTIKSLPKNPSRRQKATRTARNARTEARAAEPAQKDRVLRQAIRVEMETTLDGLLAKYRGAYGLQPEPERVFAEMLEKRVLRRASKPEADNGSDIGWQTPLGDLLLALTVGPLAGDAKERSEARDQFGEKALHHFADELELICATQIEEREGDRAWDVVSRLTRRMRAAAIVQRKLSEARLGPS